MCKLAAPTAWVRLRPTAVRLLGVSAPAAMRMQCFRAGPQLVCVTPMAALAEVLDSSARCTSARCVMLGAQKQATLITSGAGDEGFTPETGPGFLWIYTGNS
ncbi:hypothetical protein SCAR479_03204 [Seiridium cardinale]|uniref:Uncharacterized protein n=1 Tax=Seiridium cardinale TaxID=138064 RepID=A0ABR2Y1X6_9PEZI